MKKNILFEFVFIFLALTSLAQGMLKDFNSLDQMIDNWHISAAQANFDAYFSVTTPNFVFLGTAPGERWAKPEFMAFCKPYFDKGKAWDFKPNKRNWQFAADGKVAYLTKTSKPGWKAAEEVAFAY